jgi:hypothetical protein
MEALREERQAQGFSFSISPFTPTHITNEADVQQVKSLIPYFRTVHITDIKRPGSVGKRAQSEGS